MSNEVSQLGQRKMTIHKTEQHREAHDWEKKMCLVDSFFGSWLVRRICRINSHSYIFANKSRFILGQVDPRNESTIPNYFLSEGTACVTVPISEDRKICLNIDLKSIFLSILNVLV